MKKEDYMKLTKERLAELLAERDSQPVIPTIIDNSHLSCFEGGPCLNPFHDCVNCPRQTTGGSWTSTRTISTTDTTGKKCSYCGTKMVADTSEVYTSNPPQYKYRCPKCGNVEYGLCSDYYTDNKE